MSVVTEEMVTIVAAMVAEEATRCSWEHISEQGQAQWRSRMRAALAAVAPLIAAQERERCAVMAETHEWFVGGIGTVAPGSGQAKAIAAAIRALEDAT